MQLASGRGVHLFEDGLSGRIDGDDDLGHRDCARHETGVGVALGGHFVVGGGVLAASFAAQQVAALVGPTRLLWIAANEAAVQLQGVGAIVAAERALQLFFEFTNGCLGHDANGTR